MKECDSLTQLPRSVGPTQHTQAEPPNSSRNSFRDKIGMGTPDRMTSENDCIQSSFAGGTDAFRLTPFNDVFLSYVITEIGFDVVRLNRGSEPGTRLGDSTV
jgi:hypothetical protein